MKPKFSELSFAFAYMADLSKKLSGNLTTAPSFPSTIQEGKKGFGYDFKLGLSGIPVFLQFKLAHCMTYKSAAEFSTGTFSHTKPVDPAYRFYLMALGKSRQTSLMLKLEKRHDLVFYVAPAFHSASELNSHFISSSVEKNSRSFRPSMIKKMPDKHEHFVSYRLHGPCYRFSKEPQLIEKSPSSAAVAIQNSEQKEQDVSTVLDSMLNILGNLRSAAEPTIEAFRSSDQPPALSAQYVARTFFGCELAFFRKDA